jgi:hypothetical protein
MRRLLKWLEAAFVATAFAEEDDADTARRMIAEAEHGADRPAPEAPAAAPRPRRPGAPAIPRHARRA